MVKKADWKYVQEFKVQNYLVKVYVDKISNRVYRFEIYEDELFYGDVYAYRLNNEIEVIFSLASISTDHLIRICLEFEKRLKSRH